MIGQEQKASAEKSAYISEYFRREHVAIAERLASYGMSRIEAYNTDRWYIGSPEDATLRKYYRAEYMGRSCFVKLASHDSSSRNEIFVNEHMARGGLDFVPKLLLFDHDFDRDGTLLVTEFLEGIRDFQMAATAEGFASQCAEFLADLKLLRRLGVHHNDISRSNLLLDSQGRLVFSDFGIGYAPGAEKFHIDYRVHDGTFYRDHGHMRRYDDAYSFVRMLEALGLPDEYKATREYASVCAEIDGDPFVVDLEVRR